MRIWKLFNLNLITGIIEASKSFSQYYYLESFWGFLSTFPSWHDIITTELYFFIIIFLSSLTVNHFLMVFVPELHLKIQNWNEVEVINPLKEFLYYIIISAGGTWEEGWRPRPAEMIGRDYHFLYHPSGARMGESGSEEGKIDRRDGFSVFLPSRPHSLPFRPWMSREASERGPEVMEEGRAPRNRKIKGTKARLLAHSLPSFTGAERSEVEVGGAVMKVPLAPPVPCSLASGTIGRTGEWWSLD